MTAGELHRQLRPVRRQRCPPCTRQGGLRNRPVSVTTPDGGTWEFGYDRSGNLVSRTNPEGAVTRMTYRDGAVTSVKDPLPRGDEKLAYDRFRNLAEASDSREHLAVRLRPLGRCVERHQPQGCGAEKEYDPVGRVVHDARLRRQRHTPVLRRIDNLTVP
ncbi:RHS repeat protein [Bacteroides xylanisolvens]|nr:RHS repeat protein [Bacteroides xylanisolvens]